MNEQMPLEFLRAREKLTEAGMDRQVAEAVIEAVNDVVTAKAATSADVERARMDLKSQAITTANDFNLRITEEINRLDNRVTEETNRLDSRVTEEANRLDSRITEETNRLDSRITEEANRLGHSISDLAGEMRQGFAELRTEIATSSNASIWQMAKIIGVVAAIFALLNLFTPIIHQMLGYSF